MLVAVLLNIIMKAKPMAQLIFSKEDWLTGYESESSQHVADVAYNMFELFCKQKGTILGEKIGQYQSWFEQNDIQSICQDLKRFTQFLQEDHPEILLNEGHSPTPFMKKTPMTVRLYFSFIKSYLRQCHRIKLPLEDIKDFVKLPKVIKEQRQPISIDTLQKIFFHASKTRRTLYCVLISSGMRVGEALALRKSDFHLDEDPVRITIRAATTKTNEGRETFLSWEAVDMLKLIIAGKNDNDLVFTGFKNNRLAVLNEEQYFFKLRESMGEKSPEMLEKYPDSCRHIVNIHSMRSYFHTKASQKHGDDYANALDGHGAYLKQYYRLTSEDKAKKYKELEPSLLIEKFKPESEKTKDKIIKDLQEEFQAFKERQEIINQYI